MASNDAKALSQAEELLASGQRKNAVKVLQSVYQTTHHPPAKLQSIAMLVDCMDATSQTAEIIRLCSEGIGLAQVTKDSYLLGCLQASKAHHLNFAVSMMLHRKGCLKMVAPGWKWLGFALESIQQEFADLESRIAQSESECNHLLNEALESSKDNRIMRAYVLTMKGQIYSGRVSIYRQNHMKWSHLIQLIRWLRPLKEALMYSVSDRNAMHDMSRISIESLTEAARLYRLENDDGGEAGSLISLVVELVSERRFQEAASHIAHIEDIANRLNRPDIKERITVIRERIKTKNKNIPNYAEGERQEWNY